MPGPLRLRRLAVSAAVLLLLGLGVLATRLHLIPLRCDASSAQHEQARLRAELNLAKEQQEQLLQQVQRLSLQVQQREQALSQLDQLAPAAAQAVVPGGPAKVPAPPVAARDLAMAQQVAQAAVGSYEAARAIVPAHPRMALLVPFRQAEPELQKFVPHMHKFLRAQGIDFSIIILNQTDNFRFNRGLLFDAGFLETEDEFDYLALHDVDLLPLNPKLSYAFPTLPYHIAAPWLHPQYHYKTFIGGIILLASEHFRKLNGLSVNFWGWGREDDEFYKRIVSSGLKVERPPLDIGTNRTNTFLHLHDDDARPRDMMKVGQQYERGIKPDPMTGLNNAKKYYVVEGREERQAEGYSYTVLHLRLLCNIEETPWCPMPATCKEGYYRKPIKDHPGQFVCKRCGTKCWKGFVLVGHCTQTESPGCMKVGRDISEEEAKKWPAGTLDPQ